MILFLRTGPLRLPASTKLVKEMHQRKKNKILTADRNVIYRLITAYEAGREVNMQDILKHELMPVPVSITETDQTLRSGNKSVLAEALTSKITCPRI